ncbi:MAG TPA: hypothetical protein VF271_06435 [Rhodanobacteraceae bacterium]
MYTRTLVSIAASILITAGITTSLALAIHGSPTHFAVNAQNVTTLPSVNVIATPLPTTASTDSAEHVTVATATDGSFLDTLATDASVQVDSSHLAMPYYAFGSNAKQINKG